MRKAILDFGFWILDWKRLIARCYSVAVRVRPCLSVFVRAHHRATSDVYLPIAQSKIQNPKSKILRVAVVIAIAGAASADSLHDRILRANGLLRSGEADKALDSYHAIQVDHPESPVLDYNVGCAEYEKGVKALQSDDKKKDGAALSQAIESFNRAIQSGDPAVSESAAFNRANCLAQTAKNLGEGEAQGDRVKAFQDAIRAYDDVLKSDPNNDGAKQNIDHLRYMMKKTPPPPPPQQGGDDSKPQDNQSGKDENKQQQDQNDPSNRQDQQKPDDQSQQQNQQQEKEDNASQPDKPQDRQNQADNSQDRQQDSGQSEQNSNEEKNDAGTPPPDRQSVEALLQSLENQDKEMQKDLRKGARTARVRPSGWW
jgi:hypothetical protein